MFKQIFLSAQVKRSVIISNKHGIYELPYELPNDLRITILRNKVISRKSKTSQNYSLVPSLPPKMRMRKSADCIVV